MSQALCVCVRVCGVLFGTWQAVPAPVVVRGGRPASRTYIYDGIVVIFRQ